MVAQVWSGRIALRKWIGSGAVFLAIGFALSISMAYAASPQPETGTDVSTPSPVPLCKGTDPKKWDRCIGNLPIANLGVYTGEFRKGSPEGAGRFVGRDGSLYQGEFRVGVPNGKGRFTSTNGTVFLGEFADGVANGVGRETTTDGMIYAGSYLNGAREGQGSLTFPDGRRFEGEFKADHMSGYGKFIFPGGDSYTGVVNQDDMTEQGIYQFANGDRYVGPYKNFKPSGQGVLTMKSGLKWIGKFENGIPSGAGSLYDVNGDLIAEKSFQGFASLNEAKADFDEKKKQAVVPPKNATPQMPVKELAPPVAENKSVTDPAQPSAPTPATPPQLAAPLLSSADANSTPITIAQNNTPPISTPQSPQPDVAARNDARVKKPLSCERSGDFLVSYIVCIVQSPQVEIANIRFHNPACRAGADYLQEYDQISNAPWTDLYNHIRAHFFYRPFDYRGLFHYRDKIYFRVAGCPRAPEFTITVNQQDWTWPVEGDSPILAQAGKAE